MANLSRLLPKNFKMNTAQAWEDVGQAAANEPFFLKVWPGMVLFGNENSPITFEIASIMSNGHKVLSDNNGWGGVIQYIQNGEWITPGQSATVPNLQQTPIMDVLCVVVALGPINAPLKIINILDDNMIVVEDPLDRLGTSVLDISECHFAKSDLYPNKEIQIIDDAGYTTISPLGGASFQSELDLSFNATTWSIKQMEAKFIAPIGLQPSGTLSVTVIK